MAERVNQDSPSSDLNKDQDGDKHTGLVGKIVNFFKVTEDDLNAVNQDKSDFNKDDNGNWSGENSGNLNVHDIGDTIKNEVGKAVDVVKDKLNIDDKSSWDAGNDNKNLANIIWSGKDNLTKNENWTQRYVDYDKQDVTPRDISNDYIKDEMVGNVRGVYLKTRNLETNESSDNWSTVSNQGDFTSIRSNIDNNVAGSVDFGKNDIEKRENIDV